MYIQYYLTKKKIRMFMCVIKSDNDYLSVKRERVCYK